MQHCCTGLTILEAKGQPSLGAQLLAVYIPPPGVDRVMRPSSEYLAVRTACCVQLCPNCTRPEGGA